MNTETRKLTLAVLLAVVSILAIQPALVHATSQTVTIIARGSATSTTSTVSPSARIYLRGMANLNGGNIQLTQMSGILQIGPVFYTVIRGQGQTNSQTNTFQLNLQVGGNNPGSLVLQGYATLGEGYTVLFTPQQSNLEGQYSLWLYGDLLITQTPYS
ncbi:MAG: hypothetical protein ABSF00_02860 [Candidatus Bathyarchaeia archaeon]